MALALRPFDGLTSFLSDFQLQKNQAAALFARSPRTLRRWLRRGRVPGQVLDLVRIVREQRAPIAATFARDQVASSPDWTARLARPRPASRQRCRLVRIAEAYAANGWTERAAEALREAWPLASCDECMDAARELVAKAQGARAAALERQHVERAARRAAAARRYRRRC